MSPTQYLSEAVFKCWYPHCCTQDSYYMIFVYLIINCLSFAIHIIYVASDYNVQSTFSRRAVTLSPVPTTVLSIRKI